MPKKVKESNVKVHKAKDKKKKAKKKPSKRDMNRKKEAKDETPGIPEDSPVHIIFCVDNSGSMKTRDVEQDDTGLKITRSESVFRCIQDFISGHHVQSTIQSGREVLLSIVSFNYEGYKLMERRSIQKDQMTSVLNNVEEARKTQSPQGDTLFVKGLNLVQKLVQSAPTPEQVSVCLVSDGRPADLNAEPPMKGERMQRNFNYRKQTFASVYHPLKFLKKRDATDLYFYCPYDKGMPVSQILVMVVVSRVPATLTGQSYLC